MKETAGPKLPTVWLDLASLDRLYSAQATWILMDIKARRSLTNVPLPLAPPTSNSDQYQSGQESLSAIAP